MSNFINISTNFRAIMHNATEAERFVYDSPVIAGTYIRLTLEGWVHWIYENEPKLSIPYDTTINSMLREPDFVQLFDPDVVRRMHSIRTIGNRATHTSIGKPKISIQEAIHGLKLLHGLCYYLMNIYSSEYIPTPVFDEDQIPLAQQLQKNILQSQIKDLEEKEKLAKEKLDEERQKQANLTEALKKQLEELQKQNEILRQQNQSQTTLAEDPNEELTRAIYIDQLLTEAGWDLSRTDAKEFRVKHMPTDSGEGFADYVLWADDGKPLAVVEAKRTSRDAKEGEHQAELYALALEKMYGQRPNIFLTNGYQIYFYDWEYPLREVQGFYNQEELSLNIQRRSTKKSLQNIKIKTEITDRYYQQEAIKAVAERLEQKHRGALLVMATGTGKTRTAASLIDVLTNANWAKRVLFLADRTALVKQAKDNLNDYLPTLPAVNLVDEKENKNSRLVFSTYQTLINLIDDAKTEQNGKMYGVGHFDVIIFDEIHRSVYNKYKAIFDYFDGIKIGLTATPKETTDKNTYELFGLSFGNPTYFYEYDKAVEEHHLVPYKSYSVETKFLRDGIKYADLSDEDKKEYEEKFCDPITGEIPDEIEATAMDRWLYNNNTADVILKILMEKGIKVDEGNTLAKTIIFCKNRKHSEFIKERFDANYPQYQGQFLKVIDYKTEYKDDVLDNFKQKDKMPQIACSVDMLDTGIDVPEVCNLVFLKPVKSSIKFNQMIGRGTRKCKNLFGYGQDKTEFLILDFCQNFEFFAENPEGADSGERQMSLNEKIFNLRLTLSQLLVAQSDEETQKLGNTLLDILHQQVILLYTLERDSFVVRPHIKIVEHYQNRQNWDNLTNDNIRDLSQSLAPIILDNDKDTPAKAFDMLIYWLITYHIEGNPKYKLCIEKVRNYSEKLQKQTSIPQVKNKMQFLKLITTDEYWESITPKVLENLRQELRELIKFLEKPDQPIVKTDIEDTIINIDEVSKPTFGVDKEAYQRKIKQFLEENKNDLSIDKLRKNIKITENDLIRLEEMLLAQGSENSRELFTEIMREELQKKLGKEITDNDGNKIGIFIRSVVGMDKAELQKAFAKISNYSEFNFKQMTFIDEIINTISQNGILEFSSLQNNSRLENIYSAGMVDLFGIDIAKEIKSVMENIKNNSVA